MKRLLILPVLLLASCASSPAPKEQAVAVVAPPAQDEIYFLNPAAIKNLSDVRRLLKALHVSWRINRLDKDQVANYEIAKDLFDAKDKKETKSKAE